MKKLEWTDYNDQLLIRSLHACKFKLHTILCFISGCLSVRGNEGFTRLKLMQHKIIVHDDNLNVDKGYCVPLCLDSSKMLLFEFILVAFFCGAVYLHCKILSVRVCQTKAAQYNSANQISKC